MTMEFVKEFNCYWPSEENQKDYAHAKARIGAIDVTVKYLTDNYKCIQAGGWIGMWAIELAKHFDKVWVWEPVPYLYEVLDANAADDAPNEVTTWNEALGPVNGTLELMVETGGCTSAFPSDHPKAKSRQTGRITVPMRTIDSLNLSSCGALFLDVERYELQVLEGAKDTIKKYSPVLSLEVLKGEDKAVEKWAAKNGYKLRDRSFNDWILTR